MPKFRQDHPRLRVVVTLDALYANAPVIRELRAALMPWIIRVKQGRFAVSLPASRATGRSRSDGRIRGGRFRWRASPLAAGEERAAETNRIRKCEWIFLEAWEPLGGSRQQHFTWIVDPVLRLCRDRAERLMWGGRSRWKIENETFNTLKNQGYHLEHNYGHGHQNLSVVLMQLMMLAFLVDQIQQLCCPLFNAAWEKCVSKRSLWERVREGVPSI